MYKICLDETTDDESIIHMYVCMYVCVCARVRCPSWVRGLYVRRRKNAVQPVLKYFYKTDLQYTCASVYEYILCSACKREKIPR